MRGALAAKRNRTVTPKARHDGKARLHGALLPGENFTLSAARRALSPLAERDKNQAPRAALQFPARLVGGGWPPQRPG